MWFSASDDGTTWSAPVELPGDGGDSMGGFLSIAADGKGTLSIASDFTGGSDPHGACGGPKLSTSTDLATWTTCGPALEPDVRRGGNYVQLAYMKSGKRVMAFDDYDANPNSPLGSVIVWREP